jgi:Cu(I)/Ag(I) efflux system periplasmic protein CusF
MKLHLLIATTLAMAASVHAQTPAASPGAMPGMSGMPGMSNMAPAANSGSPMASAMSEGEVRKVDRALNKLTLRHGPIENLDMPGMTMVFRVSDPKLLDGLKTGDKVRFHAEEPNGVLTVTKIEPAAH